MMSGRDLWTGDRGFTGQWTMHAFLPLRGPKTPCGESSAGSWVLICMFNTGIGLCSNVRMVERVFNRYFQLVFDFCRENIGDGRVLGRRITNLKDFARAYLGHDYRFSLNAFHRSQSELKMSSRSRSELKVSSRRRWYRITVIRNGAGLRQIAVSSETQF